MPRKPIIRSNEHYYHVVARSNNKESFFIPKDETWKIMISKLKELQVEYQIKVAAFVLMDNHFHLLIQTPREPIDRIMYFFMKRVTLRMQNQSGRINKIFGGRYKGCLIENNHYLFNVFKYIYRNPVAAGLTVTAESYPYSTLFFHVTKRKLRLEIDDVFVLGHEEMKWINSAYLKDEAESIKTGLYKTVFEYKKDRVKRKEIAPVFKGLFHNDQMGLLPGHSYRVTTIQ